jgi:hypothetical protein
MKLLLSIIALALTINLTAQVLEKKNYIRIDQFGYLPESKKIAVIAKAVTGFNSGYGIDLDVSIKAQLRSVKSDLLVFADFPKPWNKGATDSYSGDKGYWFDFSSVKTSGEYIIRVFETNGDSVSSFPFVIGNHVYDEVLRAAVNMFYYQRVNQEKTAEYASGANWTDGAWFNRANQDISATYLVDKSKRRDVSRGWIDAGDPNKYVTFAIEAVHCLLTSYDQFPGLWDNFNLKIPESGNDIPDLLDEVKWEIDWLMNMQDYPGTGGLHIKAGILNDGAYKSPPSSDTRIRYYDKICPSASIAGAGMMAHAALAFAKHSSLNTYTTELKLRAEAAWDYYSNTPNKAVTCDNGEIEAGDADGDGDHYAKEHLAEAACAAVYLYALTGDSKYHIFFKQNYTQTRPWKAGDWGIYRSNQSEALMFYLTLKNTDSAVKNAIIAKKTSTEKSTGMAYTLNEIDNIYRSKAYYSNWGSNSLLAKQGTDNMDFLAYNLMTSQHTRFKDRAEGILNYFHGVNPFGMCYLSNMYMYKADFCADEMWHSWFAADTKYDNIDNGKIGPAPGFLSGGFNTYTSVSAPVKAGINSFPGKFTKDQPTQKAYSVDNNWQYQPWVFNEPGIYYQAGYVKLLAHFVAAGWQADTLNVSAIEVKSKSSHCTVFPNPATDYLNIDCDTELLKVSVFNLNGNLVHTVNCEKAPVRLNIGNLKNAVYVVCCECRNEKTFHKFLKVGNSGGGVFFQ